VLLHGSRHLSTWLIFNVGQNKMPLLAGIIGGFCGLLQLFAIFLIESAYDQERSGTLVSDQVFPIFAMLVMTEIICVIALSAYRISPWILRVLGDDWEANRISSAKKKYGTILQRLTLVATVSRRLIVMVDGGAFSFQMLASLCVALLPLIVPRPKT